MYRVAVLGGGITGLSAAHRIQELAQQRAFAVQVTVFESAAAAGGCVQTQHTPAALMELGADSLLAEKPAAQRLIRKLNLEAALIAIDARNRGARIVYRGRLRPLPPGFRLFAPRSLAALLRAGIFSPAGIARAAMEPFVPARRGGGDESVESFVTRRLGREVLQRLAQPLVGGIYSADPQRLSMQMALPQFFDLERSRGSLLRALGSARVQEPPALFSFRSGLAQLTGALEAHLERPVRLNALVRSVTRTGGQWSVRLADGAAVQCDAVICALPAPAAASALRETDAALAGALASIRCNSIATINLSYDARAAQLPPATGFVVPEIERRSIVAATFSSQKYAGRTGPDRVLIRAFAGGAFQGQLLALGDEELVQIAHAELTALGCVNAAPLTSVVTRWEQRLPEYAVGHYDRAAAIIARAAQIPGLALGGCAYRGVGLPDCIASGEAAAESVFGYVEAAKGATT